MAMFTTSRYASAETRRMAMALARDQGSVYVARGKRTVVQLASLARRLGEDIIHVIEEKAGKPHLLATISVSANGAWKWEGKPEILEKKI